MGETIELTAVDGHSLGAYRATPSGATVGRLVIAQEIFGVNGHIRAVCDGFAADGYAVIAPALFDRTERGAELGYDETGFARGRELSSQTGNDNAVCDLAATLDAARDGATIGVVGYCWGGALAWLVATRLDVDCAVGYYGARIIAYVHERPRCPVMLHYGERDASTPADDVARVRAAHPDATIHLYPAGHGFNCDQRTGDYHAENAAMARERTLTFLAEHLG